MHSTTSVDRRPPSRRFRRLLTALGLYAIGCSGSGDGTGGGGGCRGEDISFDCETQGQAFYRTAENEVTPLLSPVPEKGPYPVALQLTEEGVRRLLGGAVADQDVPFTGTLQLGFATANFEPEGDPIIEFGEVSGCRSCILFSIDFGIDLSTGNEPISSGVGTVKLSIPMRLQADETAGVSTLIADYGGAEVQDLYLVIYGIDSSEHDALTGALEVLLTERIQEDFGPVSLLEIGSWTIGNGEVRLLARELIVQPDDDKLVLGMQTNLPLPGGSGLDLSGPLPVDQPMAVSMDTSLFLTMSHRMFDEGEIARRYDESGDPDPTGIYGVTLHELEGNDMGNAQLDSLFRVWRIAEGYCGYAEATMPLDVTINNTRTGIDITPGQATLIAGVGSGAAALEEQELVEENQDLIDTFRGDLASAVGNTINYDSLDLEGSTIVFAVEEVTVDPVAIHSYLNFQVYANSNDGS
ncbi:hypothetical protein [Paraliomyxa miuraensis]|uniref:hypothetical protein n=1 Tax=Paraliomyxa miuraensis TaxID=376150 RepID=UPI002257A16B|nr:hypothetical protein [Paraliomyxa miuraensis]MCX4242231.1 hypothetical protein [Paraliomyxa miuraensis]